MKKQTFLLLAAIYSTLIGVVLMFVPDAIFQRYGFLTIDFDTTNPVATATIRLFHQNGDIQSFDYDNQNNIQEKTLRFP